ncbi:16757_t:CDS:2, partial [Dentiscutata erythropus]
QNYHELLAKDYINKTNNQQQGENEALLWIDNFLKENSCDMTQCGLPQPHGYNIADGFNEENATLSLLNTTDNLNNTINFTFSAYILNNPTKCLQRAILCPLNIEVNLINDTILNQLEGDATELYSADNLADNENSKLQNNNMYQRNMINFELLNSFNASGVPKHCLKLKRG